MVIIETPIFTRRIQDILSDEDYRLLQAQLVQKPDAGKIIPGSGGLRKLRWSASGRGKQRWRQGDLLLVCIAGGHFDAVRLP